MSYCRFGWDDSDVYVFFSANKTLECCGCTLDAKNWNYESTEDMVRHLQAHIDAGHTVPEYVIPDIIEDHENIFPDQPLSMEMKNLADNYEPPSLEIRMARMKQSLLTMTGLDEETADDLVRTAFRQEIEAKASS